MNNNKVSSETENKQENFSAKGIHKKNGEWNASNPWIERLTETVQKHPILSMGAAAIFGFLLVQIVPTAMAVNLTKKVAKSTLLN